jgi:2-polyprenyl-3-methyl-5-hydroxy-6-metoxy-1,4-benzoquinol methylase
MDIGCGEGVFLRLLRDAGYETIGLEPSRTAVKRAQESGLYALHGRLEYDKTYEPVDLVIMSHVLEHIKDFPEALRKVGEIAPGGYLLLVQTNYRGWVPRLYPRRWYAWVVDKHYWHFTPRSVTAYAAKCGYKPVACAYTSIVHEKWKLRLIAQAARLVPGAGDQFHLLLKHQPDRTARES